MKDNNSKEKKYCFVIKMKKEKCLLSNEWLYLWQDRSRMFFFFSLECHEISSDKRISESESKDCLNFKPIEVFF